MERSSRLLTRVVLAITFILCSGCEQLLVADALAGKTVALVVTQYCKLPEPVRTTYRTVWKERLHPNSITITCMPME